MAVTHVCVWVRVVYARSSGSSGGGGGGCGGDGARP